jgi:hypothetical protein
MDIYDKRSAKYWKQIWEIICDMVYLRRNISKIIYVKAYDTRFFEKLQYIPSEITLDYTWKLYSEKYHEGTIVPELESIYVPKELFVDSGVLNWFKYSFPNCKIQYW